MDDTVRDFLTESNENLDRLDQELVQLESDPTSKPLLDGIFRTIHTIKGRCGFLGFTHLQTVAHTGESLLAKLRDGQLRLNAGITGDLLAMVDAIRRMLSEIQATEHDGDSEHPELFAQLKQLQGEQKQPVPLSVPQPPAQIAAQLRSLVEQFKIERANSASKGSADEPRLRSMAAHA